MIKNQIIDLHLISLSTMELQNKTLLQQLSLLRHNPSLVNGSASTSAKNTIYKGWILTLQDGSSTSTNLKWIPKYAVCSRLERTLLLYDCEVSSQQATGSALRMDGGVRRDQFIQHGRAKSDHFEASCGGGGGGGHEPLTKYLVNDMSGIAKSTSISNRLSNLLHMASRGGETTTATEQSSFDDNNPPDTDNSQRYLIAP